MKGKHGTAGKTLRNCMCDRAMPDYPVPESGISAAQGFFGIAFKFQSKHFVR